MIYGFSSEGDTNAVVDRCVAAGVHLARGPEFNTGWSVGQLESVVIYAAQRGVKLLLLANAGSPDMAIGNLVAMIQRVGPAGTLWSGGNAQYAQWAPTHIECGNEWSYSYRGNPASNAVGVANTVNRFYNAVGPTLGANAMKLICEGEDASSGNDAFLNSLVSTQPNIRNMVDGWVIHGYGPQVQEHSTHWGYPNFQRLHNRLNARGWTTDKIWITENGISSDNGATMTQGGSPNNYGYKVNCTYAEAGARILAIARHHGTSAPWSSRVYCYLQYQAFDQQGSGSGQREHYFGIYKNDKSPKGALTSTAIQLATEFPYGGSTPPPPPDPGGGDPPGFVIDGQTMRWGAVSGASGYKTYERDNNTYTSHGAGVFEYTPAARAPGTSIQVGWTWIDTPPDPNEHWQTEQTITYPGTLTALGGSTSITFSTQGAVTEAASQSAEITDVECRMVDVSRTYVIPRYFQTSTGRECLWDSSVSKFFYKP